MVRTRPGTETTHRIRTNDLSVGDAVRLSHADVVVTRLESFDDENAPTIRDHEFGYVGLNHSNARPDHVSGVSATRNVEAVAKGDYFDFDGDTIPDDAIDIRARVVTCDKCGTDVDADDEPWASFSANPHGTFDEDESFAVSLCGDCSRKVVAAMGGTNGDSDE